MIIFLVGLPGSGKTTIGKLLAKELNYQFKDLDKLIEEREGKTIGEIFKKDGEPTFRDIEMTVLHECYNFVDTVVATGGGTPCFHDNMAYMNSLGKTIFLDVSVTEIKTRLQKKDLQVRPLFSGLSENKTTELLNKMRKDRLPFYEQSTIKITDTTRSIKSLIMKIKN